MKKTSLVWSALVSAVWLAPTASAQDEKDRGAKPIVLNFDKDEVGKLPADFTTALTGGGGDVAWSVIEDKTAPSGERCLAQTSTDETGYRFPLCVYGKLSAKDVAVAVSFKPVSGRVDQGGGIVVRYQDKDNYYIARANALEDNVRLYHVVKGKRKQFAGIDAKVESGKWHSLKLVAKGTHFQVHYDGKLAFEADDETFKDAGKVGLWTKADSVIHFDDLTIEGLNENAARESDDDEVAGRLDDLQQTALEELQAKDYDKAIASLKKVLDLAESSRLAAGLKKKHAQLASYNLACALALTGKKPEAVKHFARSVELGFRDWKHVDADTDLDAIRDEAGFKKAIADAKSGAKPATTARPFLGIQMDPNGEGVVIAGIAADTAAAKARLKAGDRILKVGEKAVGSPQELLAALVGRAVGDTVALTVERGGWTKTIQVTLGARPKDDGDDGDEDRKGGKDDDGDE